MSRLPAISAQDLSKRYIIGHQVAANTLRDAISDGVKGLWRLVRGRRQTSEEFWALRDLNFSIDPGEVVGVIGRNGAGKSTLLKVLSRITEPTTGRIQLHGRIASLLEVGTGFHPELSGRENIFLNGAILGMTRAEIRARFDEIVAFAEVERFLDTPVKRYSSGMYVRLAFAVAAHLNPEILIVDEVLAVGDAAFQKKCLGKMRDVAETGGRTVLFVSHNMSVMMSLCQRALFLEKGRLKLDSNVRGAVDAYLSHHRASTFDREVRPDMRATLTHGALVDDYAGSPPGVIVEASVIAQGDLRVAFEVRLHDHQGQPVAFASLGSFAPAEQVQLHAGENHLRCRLPVDQLANGSYGVTLNICLPFQEVIDRADNLLTLDLELPPPAGESHRFRQDWELGATQLPLQRI